MSELEWNYRRPWDWCVKFAEALKISLARKTPAPVGNVPRDSVTSLYSVLKRAMKGLQDPERAYAVAQSLSAIVATMTPGNESLRLADLTRESSTRGCEVRFMSSERAAPSTLLAPYPAFVWDWSTLVAYPWLASRDERLLSLFAFFIEMRRRARDVTAVRSQFVTITDSMDVYRCLVVGYYSPQPNLNRILRRIGAVMLGADLAPRTLWTISPWNAATAACHRFGSS